MVGATTGTVAARRPASLATPRRRRGRPAIDSRGHAAGAVGAEHGADRPQRDPGPHRRGRGLGRLDHLRQRHVQPASGAAPRLHVGPPRAGQRLTERLARAGNEQAIAFRPAAILAVEAVVDTDTFRSIFRTAIRQTHESLVDGLGGAGGLDLSDSFALVSASLEARRPRAAPPKPVARGSDGAWPTSRSRRSAPHLGAR